MNGGVRVKICGITDAEDARHAVRCGAGALGFVFFEKSPRCLSPERAREIVSGLPPFVTTVGLFVNEDSGRINEIVDFCGLDAIQLHGDETPEKCRGLNRRVIKALRVKDAESVAYIADYPVSTVLLDAWVPGSYGGTGRRFDWDLAARVAEKRRIILAGGLTPENVGEAVRIVRPYAVDVSSGVEAEAGRKDPARVAAFINNAKSERFVMRNM